MWRARWLERTTSLFALALLFSTWPLWHGPALFPQVPLLEFATQAPVWLDNIATYLLVACLILTLVPRFHRVAEDGKPLPGAENGTHWLWWAIAGLWLTLFILNQHRLQPWAYQFLLFAMVFAVGDAKTTVALCRALVASIYIHSALGKFDHAFYNGMGRSFLEAGAGSLFDIDDWSTVWRQRLIMAIPAIELWIGGGLAWITASQWNNEASQPTTHSARLFRDVIVAAAVVMHVVLLRILGPWGLNHHLGVLIWNLFFIAQALLLFGTNPNGKVAIDKPALPDADSQTSAKTRRPRPPTRRKAMACTVIMGAVLMPFLSRFGLWDHWLAWGLYSSGHGSVVVFVNTGAADQLPPQIQQHLKANSTNFQQLDLGDWSLRTLHAPIYPSDRFQTGVAAYVARLPQMERWLGFGRLPLRHWWTREREYQRLNVFDLQRLQSKFHFNAKPR